MILIDLHYLINVLLPPVHRLGGIIYYLRAAMKPLDDILQAFYSFFDQVKYNLLFNGQVLNLEHILNNKFDNTNRGIYITDAINVDQVYLFNTAELNEITYIYNTSEISIPVYINNESEVQNADFVVNIPSGVVFNIDQLKFYVNKYRCFGMRWQINIV